MSFSVLRNIDLFKYSTMRLHSEGEIMYVPHNRKELVDVLSELISSSSGFYLLSAGSNIVFAEKVKIPIINLMNIDDSIEYLGNNLVKVGCSTRIQKLINSNKEHSLGGFEYLYSVPSSVGGAVYMNAGRGRNYGTSISDYLESVDYLDLQDLVFKTRFGNDGFSYRHSPFQDMNVIILNVTFMLQNQTAAETDRLINERMTISRKYLSAEKPSCGTAFCKANPVVMRLMRGYRHGGACLSKKTSNWISNVDNATASDVIYILNKVQRIHSFFGLSCEQEIRVLK